ncbi:uncharacterized protein LOC120725887 isoform X2 [Simochromis diagramma]|uniref:uncharacterized protein LOC120725887 isoform X2 n=1 Tax=Simochromis diagramma TaxID=43689 RepID=UPI001A7E33BD|nr:uncharacterized protein LOC120725887 isoform X2 [Simochromis diagramma]
MKLLMMIVLLLLGSQHALGVEVYEGEESVLLPCQVPADVSSSSTSAVWDRDELKKSTVHLRLKSSDDLNDQNSHYHGRTSMRVDALQTGDLSLTLRKPTVSDSGTYTCTALKDGQAQRQPGVVHLKVTEPPPVWPIVLLAVLVPLIIPAAAFVLCVCCASKRMKDRQVPQSEVVEVGQQESVLLSFQTTANLPRDVTVQWTRSDSNTMVHVYESGKDQPGKQDPGYRGRTKMNEDPLRTRDLSLTLKDTLLTDRGVYTCTVKKDGHMLLQKSVALKVKAPELQEVEWRQGDKSVLLPFNPTADLPQDATVVWRLTVFKHMMVHVYERGKDQPDKQDPGYRGRTEMKKDPLRTGDLSLTLKDPLVTDSEDYTCTVYNKGGDKLLQKVVLLRVTESLPDIVEVTEGEESVLLPFKTTPDLPQDVTVEWTGPKHMKVHVYERGNNQPDKQDQGYRGRTEMKKDPLSTKDLSLTLKDPLVTDSGVYTCTIYSKDGDKLLQKSVTVRVTEVVGLTQEKESVDLPFKTTAVLPQDVTVEWTDPKHRKVHVYESGKDQPDKQDPGYRGRTEMKDKDPLRTGDLSLTLKYPNVIDSAVYTCTVYNKGGDKLLQKSVTLIVRTPWMAIVEVTQREESVQLRFQIPPDLLQDVTVEWKHLDSNKMVHVYASGKYQPDKQDQDYRGRTEMKEDPLRTGDVSLTLKDPHFTDSGVYTCTVYNKDGKKLLEDSAILRVRVTLMDTMAEMLPHPRPHKHRRAQSDLGHRNRNHEDVPLMGVQSA